eukprot:TRINITY_DN22178_c0_g1_i1.p1 TRINITY_DN22178_c0_g1~~TRINITY_DN22178_c0_g1_i1.p1  ORF type:complete len:404 (+),score=83.29 TRINITY_DN22178_c0_g1_i1:133-1344(+)
MEDSDSNGLHVLSSSIVVNNTSQVTDSDSFASHVGHVSLAEESGMSSSPSTSVSLSSGADILNSSYLSTPQSSSNSVPTSPSTRSSNSINLTGSVASSSPSSSSSSSFVVWITSLNLDFRCGKCVAPFDWTLPEQQGKTYRQSQVTISRCLRCNSWNLVQPLTPYQQQVPAKDGKTLTVFPAIAIPRQQTAPVINASSNQNNYASLVSPGTPMEYLAPSSPTPQQQQSPHLSIHHPSVQQTLYQTDHMPLVHLMNSSQQQLQQQQIQQQIQHQHQQLQHQLQQQQLQHHHAQQHLQLQQQQGFGDQTLEGMANSFNVIGLPLHGTQLQPQHGMIPEEYIKKLVQDHSVDQLKKKAKDYRIPNLSGKNKTELAHLIATHEYSSFSSLLIQPLSGAAATANPLTL